MATPRLYIIGNGFDLHHGIPSTYGHFQTFARDLDSHVFRTVEKYLPAGEEWWDLESSLSRIDVDYLISDLEQFMPGYGADDWSDAGHHDFQYEVGRVVEGLSTELRARFGRWVRELPIPSQEAAPGRLRAIDPGAPFFTFNYTSTLRDVYGVPDAMSSTFTAGPICVTMSSSSDTDGTQPSGAPSTIGAISKTWTRD